MRALKHWITEKEVAEITSLSVSTLQKHRFNRCGIAYAKIGRSVRYKLDDVLAFMEEYRVKLSME